MIKGIGDYAQLEVVKEVTFGVYLDGGPFGEILLPKKEVPATAVVGTVLDVFIYCDSEDRIIATTARPVAKVGEFAVLPVVDVGNMGAFLAWGIPKHLFIPFKEQRRPLLKGEQCVVYIYFDTLTDRIVGTTRLNRHLAQHHEDQFAEGQRYQGYVIRHTDLGYQVFLPPRYVGQLFFSEVFQPLQEGETVNCYVKHLREDGKIDLSLHRQGVQAMQDATEIVVQALRTRDGFLPLTDSSTPDDIYFLLQISKKNFKKAVGILYRQRRISLHPDGIRLL